MSEPSPDQFRARLDKVEELQSFADRAAEQLSDQMVALERKVREFEARLHRLEQQCGQLGERVERIPLPPAGNTGPPPGA